MGCRRRRGGWIERCGGVGKRWEERGTDFTRFHTSTRDLETSVIERGGGKGSASSLELTSRRVASRIFRFHLDLSIAFRNQKATARTD